MYEMTLHFESLRDLDNVLAEVKRRDLKRKTITKGFKNGVSVSFGHEVLALMPEDIREQYEQEAK